MNLGKRLIRARERKNLSQKQAASLLGLSNVVLNRYEKNERKPTPEMLNHLAHFFEVSTDWLLCRTDGPSSVNADIIDNLTTSKIIRVPVYSELATNKPMEIKENIENYDYLIADNNEEYEYFYLRVRDNSMLEARLQTGDFALVRKQQTLENGQIGVFIVDNDYTIKRFYKQGDLAILKPENMAFQPRVINIKDINLVGLVVGAKIVVR